MKSDSLGHFFGKLWKILGWEKCNTLIPTYLLPELSTIMGNSGDVSQGRCGGGAPYCGPRGARFN